MEPITSEKVELLPCKHCEAVSYRFLLTGFAGKDKQIECLNCGYRTPYKTERSQAVEEWNHRAPSPVESELRKKLERYEYDEKQADKEPKTFQKEIDACHPMETEDEDDFKRYDLALQLVGERHGKYELVDLVNWLLCLKDGFSQHIACQSLQPKASV